MAIFSDPDRCPSCHFPTEFGSADYRWSKLPGTRLAAAIVTVIAGIAIGFAGIVLIQMFWGEIKPSVLFRRRESPGPLVTIAVLIELAIVFFIVRVIFRRLINVPRVLRHRCADCGAVHIYRVAFLAKTKG